MSRSPAMHLQLLGVPRVLAAGEPLHVGSRKALALLCWVALEGVATRERLAPLLWPDVDAAAARRNLRRELFRLRELGVPLHDAVDGVISLDAAMTVDGLRPRPDSDLWHPAEAAFEGLEGVGSPELDNWLQRRRDDLRQQRQALLAREAERCLAAGDRSAALALLRRRAAEDPCDEAVAAAAMRLGAELDDRAGALHDFQRLVDALRHDLDAEPSAPIQALARELRGVAAMAWPSRPATDVAAPAPPSPSTASGSAASVVPQVVPYVRREAVQQRIESAWQQRQRVYLHGPAGTGKTRLANEMAAARGAWLRVACEPQDAELPYASVIRLLRALRDSTPDVVLPDWVRRELSQLMPELGEPPQMLAADEARQRLLAAIGEAWRLLMLDNFGAVVLDDWHWSDAVSADIWSRLEAPSADEGVAWLIVFRSAQLPPAALERQRAEIDGGRGVAVALEGFAPGEVLALTHALSGSSGGRLFSERLHDATEGNPFFLLETLRHLSQQGLLVADANGWRTPFDEHTERYAELPVPASVRAAVQARVRALGASVQRLLEAASLGGAELDASLLAGVVEVDEEAAVAALEHARSAQLVHDTGSGWRFAHDLVRQSLAFGLSAGRKRLLHERLARRLEAGGATAALIAAQWEAAQRPEAAIRWRVAAAEAAVRVHALDEAMSGYARALADGAVGAVAAAIHAAMAQLHVRRVDRAAADAAFVAAAVAAARQDDGDGRLAWLAVQLARAEHLCNSDRMDEALALVSSLARDLDGKPSLHARALAVRGNALMLAGRHGEAQALYDEAVALLEAEPEARAQLAKLLLDFARSTLRRGDLPRAGDLARRAEAVHASIDGVSGMAQSLTIQGIVHQYSGRPEEARPSLERARALARLCGNVSVHRGAILNLVKLGTDAGDVDGAVRLLDEGEALAPGFEHRRAEQAFREARYFVHFLRGEMGAAREAAGRLLAFASVSTHPHEQIGALHLVVDLFLLDRDLVMARKIVDDAQRLVDMLAAGADSTVYSAQQALKQAWLKWLEGRPAEALAALPPVAAVTRVEDRVALAWLGCAAALDMKDRASARRHLERVAFDEEVPQDQLALWLLQRLRLAAEEGVADARAEARGRELLASNRVPGLLARPLAEALGHS